MVNFNEETINKLTESFRHCKLCNKPFSDLNVLKHYKREHKGELERLLFKNEDKVVLREKDYYDSQGERK